MQCCFLLETVFCEGNCNLNDRYPNFPTESLFSIAPYNLHHLPNPGIQIASDGFSYIKFEDTRIIIIQVSIFRPESFLPASNSPRCIKRKVFFKIHLVANMAATYRTLLMLSEPPPEMRVMSPMATSLTPRHQTRYFLSTDTASRYSFLTSTELNY